MVRSPTFSFSRPISASRASAGRLFNEASPAARNASRQPLSSAAVTPSSRDSSSRSSPRSRRSTASCLRRADIRRRCPGVGPATPAWWARSAGPTPTPTASSILHLLAVPYLQTGVSMNRSPGDQIVAVQLGQRQDPLLDPGAPEALVDSGDVGCRQPLVARSEQAGVRKQPCLTALRAELLDVGAAIIIVLAAGPLAGTAHLRLR